MPTSLIRTFSPSSGHEAWQFFHEVMYVEQTLEAYLVFNFSITSEFGALT